MRRALLVVVAVLAGCSSPDPSPAICPGELAEALVNAATSESYLGLAPEHLGAIVQVTTGTGPEAPLCSGTFVTPEWVVTAAHCLVIDAPHVVLTPDGGVTELATVVEQVAHPSVDVALLRVAPAPKTAFEPLPPLGPNDRAIVVNDSVELAGYGVTEAGTTRELRFLVEPVTRVEDADLIVNGLGESGACDGDSGGPLLVRDSAGAVRVGGVLTSGSASCLETDRYVRLDRLESWLDEMTGVHTSSFDACGGIDQVGRCLYGSALFCEAGKLRSEPCTHDRLCGWDATSAGYRCVEPSDDPCQGVDAVGVCRDDVVMKCRDGTLEREPCTCATSCRVDARTGAAKCVD